MHSTFPLRPGYRGRETITVSNDLRDSKKSTSVSRASTAPLDHKRNDRTLGLSAVSNHLSATLNDDLISEAPSDLLNPEPIRALPFVSEELSALHKSEQITNGFKRLHLAIMKLVDRLPESTLDDKFDLVSQWIESYRVDVVPSKLAKSLAVVLDASTENAKELGGPAASKAIACCFAVTQLVQAAARIRPVMGTVADEALRGLMQCMFVNPPSQLPDLQTEDYDRESLLIALSAFRQKTYFQESADLRKRLDSVKRFMLQNDRLRANQKAVLINALGYWQGHSKRFIFGSWRAFVRQEQRSRAHEQETRKLREEIARLKQHANQLQISNDKHVATVTKLTKELQETRENCEIKALALQYDKNELEKQVNLLTGELSGLNESHSVAIDGYNFEVEGLKDRLARVAKDVDDFVSGYFKESRNLQTSIMQTHLSDEGLASWMRTSMQNLKADSELMDAAALAKVSKANLNAALETRLLRGGDPGLLSIALCMFATFRQHFQTEPFVEHLLAPLPAQRAQNILQWLKEKKVRIPSIVTDDDLINTGDQGAYAVRIVANSIMMTQIQPTDLYHAQSPLSSIKIDAKEDVVEEAAPLYRSAIEEHSKFQLRLALQSVIERDVNMMNKVGSSSSKDSELSPAEEAEQPFYILTPQSLGSQVPPGDRPRLLGITQKHYRQLRSLFKQYSHTEDISAATAVMTTEAFIHLCRDIRVGSARVDRDAIASIAESLGNLAPRNFVVALVVLAKSVYIDAPHSEAFRLLVEDHLKPFAYFCDVGQLTTVREHFVVRVVLEEIKDDLFKVFRKYCIMNPGKMGFHDFTKLMADGKWDEDGRVSNTVLSAAFKAINVSSGEMLIGFERFVSLLVATALLVNNESWIAPEKRVKTFLLEKVIPPFAEKCGLKYVSPL